MSIPRFDPSVTLEDLRAAGQVFLDAGQAYWDTFHKAGHSGAIVWLQGTGGELVLFTRGEYKSHLLQNIETFNQRTISFGTAVDD